MAVRGEGRRVRGVPALDPPRLRGPVPAPSPPRSGSRLGAGGGGGGDDGAASGSGRPAARLYGGSAALLASVQLTFRSQKRLHSA